MSSKFGTRYGKNERIFSNPGRTTRPKYSAYCTEDGTIELEECGTEYLYDDIQAYADSCDINLILARYANGETDVLSRVQGFYTDVSDMPNTYIGMFNLINKGEEFFNSLPIEEKNKFNNSFPQFLSALGSENFLERFEQNDENSVNNIEESESIQDES